jgi:hypothetical protein
MSLTDLKKNINDMPYDKIIIWVDNLSKRTNYRCKFFDKHGELFTSGQLDEHSSVADEIEFYKEQTAEDIGIDEATREKYIKILNSLDKDKYIKIEAEIEMDMDIFTENEAIANEYQDSRLGKVLFIGTKKELFDEFEDLTDSSIEAIKKAL